MGRPPLSRRRTPPRHRRRRDEQGGDGRWRRAQAAYIHSSSCTSDVRPTRSERHESHTAGGCPSPSRCLSPTSPRGKTFCADYYAARSSAGNYYLVRLTADLLVACDATWRRPSIPHAARSSADRSTCTASRPRRVGTQAQTLSSYARARLCAASRTSSRPRAPRGSRRLRAPNRTRYSSSSVVVVRVSAESAIRAQTLRAWHASPGAATPRSDSRRFPPRDASGQADDQVTMTPRSRRDHAEMTTR